MRSRPRCRGCRRGLRGITSACAEQTVGVIFVQSVLGDHLRVCGADRSTNDSQDNRTGSPPRVRSRPKGGGLAMTAKVGNTDHLRVCGADVGGGHAVASSRGSPPRVRSRHHGQQRRRREGGITSACAEQTIGRSISITKEWDHLRVCGADYTARGCAYMPLGSPPRVRSRRSGRPGPPSARRITSACAEQTVVFYCVLSQLNGVEYLIYALRRVS